MKNYRLNCLLKRLSCKKEIASAISFSFTVLIYRYYFIFDNTTDVILKTEIINRFIYNYSKFLYIEAETNEIFGRVWCKEKQDWIIEKIGDYKEKDFLELA